MRSRALSERMPTGPSKASASGPTEPSQTAELSTNTFSSAPFISARRECESPGRRVGTGTLRRGLTLRYPRLPHCALVCCPGLLFTETTSFDSGSMRHIAYTRLQASWARSLRPNWRRNSPEPSRASSPVEPRYVKRASTNCGVACEEGTFRYARIFGTVTDSCCPGSSSIVPSVTQRSPRETGVSVVPRAADDATRPNAPKKISIQVKGFRCFRTLILRNQLMTLPTFSACWQH